MIERNLRDVTIRKYGTAFLEAFGMLPVTYFGCVGDNLTDNYANLQVAINESIKKGLKYIFVPDGTYYYTGTLLNTDEVMFIGNPTYAKIYDGTNEIRIYQIGTQIPFWKGTETLDEEITENGYINIFTGIKNASDAILVANGKAITIYGDLNLVDGKLLTENSVLLAGTEENGVYLEKAEITKLGIEIQYNVVGTGAVLSTSVEWRVR